MPRANDENADVLVTLASKTDIPDGAIDVRVLRKLCEPLKLDLISVDPIDEQDCVHLSFRI